MNVKLSKKETKKTIRDADALEFLPAALEISETPPRPLGRVLAIVISTFFVAAVVWAGLSPIDIVAIAEGQVVPTGQIKTVQSFQSGVISAIHVEEGTHVQAGQTVVSLDATEAETNRRRTELELARAELSVAVSEALLAEDPVASFVVPDNVDAELVQLSRDVIRERWRSYQSALSENTAERERTESEIHALEADNLSFDATLAEYEILDDAAQRLDAVGLATNSQLANARLQLISTRNQQQNVAQRILQAEFNISRAEAQKRQIRSRFLGEVSMQLTEARQATLIAADELARLREREALYQLLAPVSGTVNEILVHTVGGVVSPSERILTIVPDDVSMEIQASLPNKDIGFVEVGQAAEIKLEAFPFTRFGVIGATVTLISSDALNDPDRGPVFSIRLAPEEESLVVRNQEIRLSPGMRATAEIKTGHRTVLEFFLTPLLRYRDEAIRER